MNVRESNSHALEQGTLLSSFGGDVDDDHDVAAVRVQLHHVAVDVLGAEGVHVLGLSTTTMTVGQGKWDDIKH